EDLDPRRTIAALFEESGVSSPRNLVHATSFPNLSLLPGHDAAARFNEPEPWATGMRQFVLRDAIAEVEGEVALGIIDCPPHIQLWAWAALVAAEGVVDPVQPEDYGAQGLKAVRRIINRVQREVNGRLVLIGYLVSMFNKSLSVHVTYEGFLRELHGQDVFL